MGKSDPDQSKIQRPRQLNVIYFVDSARTRSLVLSLGRLKLLIVGALGLVVWSVCSLVLIVAMLQNRVDLRQHMRIALTTIFEYETRDEHVFDLAYPRALAPSSTQPVAIDGGKKGPLAGLPMTAGVGGAATVKAAPVKAAAGKPILTGSPVVAAAPPVVIAKSASAASAASAAVTTIGDAEVSVGHAAVEPNATGLELRFDLTSKNASDRVEGFIYAVAEFKPDQGDRVFIGAPVAIAVQPTGEPTSPMRAAPFAIRRFKQKRFSFPLAQDKSGVVTGVRIVILDRAGVSKSAVELPADIRIGQHAKLTPSKVPPTSPKPG